MQLTKNKIAFSLLAWCGVLALLSGGAIAAARGAKLVSGGKVLSNNVRVIDGKAYVPLADLAKANGMVVVPISGGYEIKTAGGATPIKGLQGEIGDVLFDGKWRFQVLGGKWLGSYKMQHKSTIDYALYNAVADFDGDTRTFTSKEGRALIAIRARVTNARNKGTHALWVSNTDTRTALADLDGESHPPFAYDMDEAEPFHSKKLLPGAKTDFTILFSVPADTSLKDLVFTLRTINNNDKGNDARVSLRKMDEVTNIPFSDK